MRAKANSIQYKRKTPVAPLVDTDSYYMNGAPLERPKESYTDPKKRG